MLCNAFDIVRIHKFSDMDDKASFQAMCDFDMQADDTEYVRTVTRKTFATAIARVYVPGTKFDCVPVLDGDQGIGKSTIVKELVTPDYFSETLSLTDIDNSDIAKPASKKLEALSEIKDGSTGEITQGYSFQKLYPQMRPHP